GITERFLWGERRVDWDDVQKVEAIAQANQSGKIERWSTEPEAAFHIVVHTRKGRVSVHRWMTGVDDFVEALRVGRGGSPYREAEQSAIDRDDPSVKSVLAASPIRETVNKVYDGVMLFKIVVLVLPLSWLGGLMVVITTNFALSGNPILDGTLVALVPWVIGFAVYKSVERARSRLFGPEHARPPLSAYDAIMTMAAAMGGPVLLYGFVPRAIESKEAVDVALALVGLFFCWIPIAEVWKSLRRA
ncbi:MAG: hypothetical protein ABIP89_17835, partial [Polyangiaceae bacterium]